MFQYFLVRRNDVRPFEPRSFVGIEEEFPGLVRALSERRLVDQLFHQLLQEVAVLTEGFCSPKLASEAAVSADSAFQESHGVFDAALSLRFPYRRRIYDHAQLSHEVLEVHVVKDAGALMTRYGSLVVVALQYRRHAMIQVRHHVPDGSAAFNRGLGAYKGGIGVIAGREGKHHHPAVDSSVIGLKPVPVSGKVNLDVIPVIEILNEIVILVFSVDFLDLCA